MSSVVDNTSGVSVTSSSEVVNSGDIGTLQNNTTTDSITVDNDPISLMAGQPVDVGAVYGRKVLIFTSALSTGDLLLADLLAGLDPHYLMLNSTVISRKTVGFEFWKGSLKITASITAPSSAYGAYNLVATPFSHVPYKFNAPGNDYPSVGTFAFNGPDAYTSFQGIHGIIDVALSNVVEITLPLFSCVDASEISLANVVNTVGGWKMSLYALAPVANANGVTAINATVNIYAEFLPDFEMFNNVPQGKIKDHVQKVSKDAAKMKPSQIGAALGSGLSTIGAAVPILEPFTAPIAAGLAAVSSIASWFGFTRTSQPVENTPVSIRTIENFANFDGADTSDVTALSVASTLSIDPRLRLGNGDDMMSNASLFQRWTMIANFTWASTDAVGTVLFSFPVTPFFFGNTLGVCYPTVAGYVGLPFRFWRGDMEYLFYVPISAFHRGKLQFVWSNSTNFMTNSDRTHTLNNAIVDVENSSTYQTTVGYSRNDPALTSVVYAATVAGRTNADVIGGTVNGFMGICVNTVLQNIQQTTTSTVRVIVLARASQNMKFGVPKHTEYKLSLAAAKVPFVTEYALQGGVGLEEGEDMTVPLIQPSGDYPLVETCFTESFESVRALIQKFSFHDGFPLTTALGKKTFVVRHFPVMAFAGTTNGVLQTAPATNAASSLTPNFHWYAWYAAMFYGQCGSVRFKLVPMQNSTGTTVLDGESQFAHWSDNNYSPMVATIGDDSLFGTTRPSTHMTLQKCQNSSILSVTSPCYMNYKFFPVQTRGALTTAVAGLFDYFYMDRNSATDIYLYSAGGPDVSFVGFNRTPRLTFNG